MLKKFLFATAFTPSLFIAGQLMAEEPDAIATDAPEVSTPAPEFQAPAADIGQLVPTDEASSEAVSDSSVEEPAGEPVVAEDTAAGEATDVAAPLEEASSDGSSADVEVIHERYPSRAVKIERHVTQDDAGNYYNHGMWTHWDESGNVLAQGEYREGKRHGKWTRWYGPKDGKVFVDTAAKGFEAPFGTEATFDGGELNGTWKVFDAKGRDICHWQFDKGVRQGRSVWFLPTGAVWQDVSFKAGQMDGDLRQLNKENKLVVAYRYTDGHRIGLDVQYYPKDKTKKKSVGGMLYAQTYLSATYDWWTGGLSVVPVPKEVKDQKHGKWVKWYANGQKQFEGDYKEDQPVGKFSWWHANGQLAHSGQYVDGMEQGKFVWWYPSGQKQVQGEYVANVPTGNWIRWTAAGKVVQSEDYRGKEGVTVEKIVDEAGDKTDIRVGELTAPSVKSLPRRR